MTDVPSFRPLPSANGWTIEMRWPDGRIQDLRGYKSESDAITWITVFSDKWVSNLERKPVR
jgi:hypothetical protein